ncbi:acyloxyacyl hydrolase [Rhodohalobacter sp. 8-1]|uniref:acyloxyacyl hydrolase n=1 Tax=Rhodohalobacter sp. 8-1 TaxID=3131972 RepID=UPI0030EE606C
MHSFLKSVETLTIVLLVCLILAIPKISKATDPIGLTADTDLKIGITTIYSPDSFAAWGKIENSSSFSLRGQVWHTRLSYKRFHARLGSELILTHRLNYPLNGVSGPKDHRTGIGIIPLSIMMPLTSSKKITPFTFFSAGGLFLNEKLPDVSGASLNYLLNIGAGLELPFIQETRVQIGYSIQHMSNANTGEQNPGIDSHMFFITVLLP